VFAQIPDDHANALRSLNRGIPLVVRYPRSPVTRAIQQLAKKLPQSGVLEPIAARAGMVASKSQQEALLASSQLG
jgi:MinD-like ATPase involved in chromosome partitioning or flagellar assembly